MLKNPGTDHPVCTESNEKGGDPPPKPPSHAEAVNLCAKLSIYRQYLSDTLQYFQCTNAIQNLPSQEQFNSKNQCLVTDFFV